MSRRSHRQKGDVALTVPQSFGRVQPCTRRAQGCVERSRGGNRVLIEVAASSEAVVLDAFDVQRVVNDLELSTCGPAGLERNSHACRRRVLDAREDCLQTLGTLRVPLSCCVRCELLVTPEQHCHPTTVPPLGLTGVGDPTAISESGRVSCSRPPV